MTGDLRAKLQVVVLIALVIAGTRTAYILYQRYEDAHSTAKGRISIGKPLDPDYYVTPKRLYPYDLKSAQDLTRQPVWVKVGYAEIYLPYDAATHHADFTHPAGKFLPLEKLQVDKVVTDVAPDTRERQLMVLLTRDSKTYAFSVGNISDGQYHYYGNEMLFIEDPHQLYHHWPPEVWRAIDQHQIKVGMNELQACMAIGVGFSQSTGDFGNRTLNYPNGGHPFTVTFQGGKAVDIKSGT